MSLFSKVVQRATAPARRFSQFTHKKALLPTKKNAKTLSAVGLKQMEKADYKGAVASFYRSFKLNKSFNEPVLASEDRLNLGNALFQRGSFESAYWAYEEVSIDAYEMDDSPDKFWLSSQVDTKLGRIAFHSEDYDSAISYLRDAQRSIEQLLAANPSDESTLNILLTNYTMLGRIEIERRNPEEAKAYLEKAMQRIDENSQEYLGLVDSIETIDRIFTEK